MARQKPQNPPGAGMQVVETPAEAAENNTATPDESMVERPVNATGITDQGLQFAVLEAENT